MNAFQLIVVPILGLLFVERVIALLRGRGPKRVASFWAVVWALAAINVAWPNLTSAIANVIGIDRGANLVLYCVTLIMFVGFFMAYTRLRRLEAGLTQLVRQLAVDHPIMPGDRSAQEASAGDRE